MHSTRSVAFTLSLVFSPVFFACGGASDASSAPSSTETGTATPATDAPPEPTAGTRGSAATGSEPPDASTSGDGGNTTSPPVASDAGPAPAPAYPPIDTSALAPCPTDTSPAQFVLPFDVDGVSCFNFTPVDVGEPASGENATLTQYAVRPATPAARLVLFLIGSGGHPSGPLQAGVDTNFYAAAVEAGNAVFAVSYKNQASICRGDDTATSPLARASSRHAGAGRRAHGDPRRERGRPHRAFAALPRRGRPGGQVELVPDEPRSDRPRGAGHRLHHRRALAGRRPVALGKAARPAATGRPPRGPTHGRAWARCDAVPRAGRAATGDAPSRVPASRGRLGQSRHAAGRPELRRDG